MDPFVIHLDPIRRHFPHHFPVSTIGYIPLKKDRVDRAFSTFNFSFILSGEGNYMLGGRRWPVLAPCVITQWPGKPVVYGPSGTWEELYVIYEAAHLNALTERGFADPSRPVWYLEDGSSLRDALGELAMMRGEIQSFGVVDRIDCLAERMALDSLIGETKPRAGNRERTIQRIVARVEKDFQSDQDLDLLAREAGLSLSTFRRLWNTMVGLPPHQFILKRRLQEAARLLVETTMSVGEIAVAVGFGDRLYFSRKFRQVTGFTASEYRKTYRYPSPAIFPAEDEIPENPPADSAD